MVKVDTNRIEIVLKKCEKRLEELDILERSCTDYNYLVLQEKYKEQENVINEIKSKMSTLNVYREKCLDIAKENKILKEWIYSNINGDKRKEYQEFCKKNKI